MLEVRYASKLAKYHDKGKQKLKYLRYRQMSSVKPSQKLPRNFANLRRSHPDCLLRSRSVQCLSRAASLP